MKKLFTAAIVLGFMFSSGAALGHHGWSWTTGENIELTGVIKKVRLGNPHGILEVEVRRRALDRSKWANRGATSAQA